MSYSYDRTAEEYRSPRGPSRRKGPSYPKDQDEVMKFWNTKREAIISKHMKAMGQELLALREEVFSKYEKADADFHAIETEFRRMDQAKGRN